MRRIFATIVFRLKEGSSAMHHRTPTLVLLYVLAASGTTQPAAAAAFVHTADGTNTAANWTRLDHPSLEAPNVVPLVTQNWNPGGVGGTYNDHPILVAIDTVTSKFLILNSDLAPMPLGASFNVMAVDYTGPSSYLHVPANTDTTGPFTKLTYPLLGSSSAIALITQVRVSFVDDVHPTGLAWGAPFGPPSAWYIVNLDGGTMPYSTPPPFSTHGPGFLVLVATSASSAFRHVASDIAFNWTNIDSPLLNDQPNALVFVTSVGLSDPGPPRELGVWYTTEGRWAIFNQDGTAMEPGTTFNVVVVNPIFADSFESGSTSAWSGTLP